MVKVFLDRLNEEKEIEVEGKIKVKKLLEKLNINRVEVVVVKDSKIVTEDFLLDPNDKIKIISVVSGG